MALEAYCASSVIRLEICLDRGGIDLLGLFYFGYERFTSSIKSIIFMGN